MENVAVPAVGNLSKEELLKLKEAMNAKALTKRRARTARSEERRVGERV